VLRQSKPLAAITRYTHLAFTRGVATLARCRFDQRTGPPIAVARQLGSSVICARMSARSCSSPAGVRRVRPLATTAAWPCGGEGLSAPTRVPRTPASLLVPGQQGASAQSTFFGGVLHRFLEDLVLQRLLAQHALQLGDLGAGRSQLRRRNHGFAPGYRRQRALPFELALLEQQDRRHAALTSHQ